MLRNKFVAFRIASVLLFGSVIVPTLAHAETVLAQHAPVYSLPNFADLVDSVNVSVVQIHPLQWSGKSKDGIKETDRSLGSGFIITSDGLIMTNAHVVKDAYEITVILSNNLKFKGTIVGLDELTDVAIIKIEAYNLSSVKIGDSSRIRAGEWVIAIGAPLGLENTVTAGIISNKARDTGEIIIFIQTDVAINPGNSGGPLFNLRGEVLGINSSLISKGGHYEGISLSIPINEAMVIGNELIANGKIIRGRVGIVLNQRAGVVGVDPGSPADLGGIKIGDIITRIENKHASFFGIEIGDILARSESKLITNSVDVIRLISNTKPGHNLSITVLRADVTHVLHITTAERKDPPPAPSSPPMPMP